MTQVDRGTGQQAGELPSNAIVTTLSKVIKKAVDFSQAQSSMMSKATGDAGPCDNSVYPYPTGCQHLSTKEMWRRFLHSPYTSLGFAVALFLVLLAIAVMVVKRSLRRRRAAQKQSVGNQINVNTAAADGGARTGSQPEQA